MIPSRRESVITIIVSLTLLLFIFAFQNCSQSLPGYSGLAASAVVRPTPYPGATAIPVPSPGSTGPYQTPAWYGTCSDDNTVNPMSHPGLDPTNQPIPVLVLNHPSDGSVAIWDIGGDGVVRGSVCSITGGGWAVVATGHFKSGYYTDLIWRNVSTGQNVIWFMQGNTRMEVAQLPNMSAPWVIQGTGDTNGDGVDDIVWRNPSTGQVLVWQMNTAISNQTITPTSMLLTKTIGSGWEIVAVKDFDGDGKADIFWRSTSGSLMLWLMTLSTDGTTPIATQQALSTSSVSTNWVIVGVGKMDTLSSDIIDIMWMNTNVDSSSGTAGHDLTVWPMIGATLAATPTNISPVPTNWTGGAVTDVNSDGAQDIIWNIGGTSIGVWLMNLTPQVYLTNYPAVQVGWYPFAYPSNL